MMVETTMDSKALIEEIRLCTVCAPHLSAGPRPIVQFSTTARLLIVGQAPGIKAQTTEKPWNDQSGKLLREWLDMGEEQFYDPDVVALIPMQHNSSCVKFSRTSRQRAVSS